jgi:hypothetical protein
MKVNNEERISKMQPKKYFVWKNIFFYRLLRLLEIADTFQRKTKAGRKSRLSVLDKLVITSMYWVVSKNYINDQKV